MVSINGVGFFGCCGAGSSCSDSEEVLSSGSESWCRSLLVPDGLSKVAMDIVNSCLHASHWMGQTHLSAGALAFAVSEAEAGTASSGTIVIRLQSVRFEHTRFKSAHI